MVSLKRCHWEISLVPPRPIRGKKRAADGGYITCKVQAVPVEFRKSELVTLSEVRKAAEGAGVQLDEPVSLHPGNVSEGVDDRDSGQAQQILVLQDLSDQWGGGEYAVQQIQSVCEKAGLVVRTTVPETQKFIAQELATIPES